MTRPTPSPEPPAPVAAGAEAAPTAISPQDQEAYDRLALMVALVRVDGTCLLVNAALEHAVRQSRRKLVQALASIGQLQAGG